ncbi:hypothetical protein [Kitasatospora sp. GAS1066B]|uniref:hypothetical protein n=1 Tax=Kitasatospora sp. GAS1066B TaxID=3156271 RepID=UPI0035113462
MGTSELDRPRGRVSPALPAVAACVPIALGGVFEVLAVRITLAGQLSSAGRLIVLVVGQIMLIPFAILAITAVRRLLRAAPSGGGAPLLRVPEEWTGSDGSPGPVSPHQPE